MSGHPVIGFAEEDKAALERLNRNSPGYVDSVQTGKSDLNTYEQEGARVSLLWKATDDFTVRLSGLW